DQYLFVRADYSLIKIAINDIILIEGLDDYLKIHLHNNPKPIVTRMTMKSILDKLSSKEFIRVHRSFIIPFDKIENVRKKIITIAGKEIPIGSSYESDFNAIFKK
ncbi:MAG: LytTR family DNA-binding domain-containing protein, partial [Bacteroidota bacterium]|nr:LytTR family DNA-binding domain-containing protein [Bacteroidota bacterium]